MVVTVDQIREGGLSLDETLSESFLTHALAEVKDTGFRPDGPALLHVKLQKTGSGVLLRGSTEVTVHTPCRRCLAAASRYFSPAAPVRRRAISKRNSGKKRIPGASDHILALGRGQEAAGALDIRSPAPGLYRRWKLLHSERKTSANGAATGQRGV